MGQFLLSQPFQFLFFFFCSPLLLLIFSTPTANSQAQPLYSTCSPSANYTKTSSFATNLKLLLPSLSSNATLTKGFYNGVIGQGPNAVYGQALCRGDATPDVCRGCINNASDFILSQCAGKSAAIWYDYCQLRYSDVSFFGNSTSPLFFYVWNINNVTDPDPFKKSLEKLMKDLAGKVEAEPWLHNFATGDADYASEKSVYGLVQCVPDISGSECDKCLQDAISLIPQCCDSRIGGRVIGHVCGLRFETSKFYGESNVEGPAPSPAPAVDAPSPSTVTFPNQTNTGTNDNSSGRIVSPLQTIAGAAIFSVVFTVL